MADAAFVEVLDATDELPVELGSLLFVQARISDDEVEELATIGMLHYHKKLLLSLNDLYQQLRSWLRLDDTLAGQESNG